MLENGEVYEIKMTDKYDKLKLVSKIILPITFADRVKDIIQGSNKAKFSYYDQNKKTHKKFLI